MSDPATPTLEQLLTHARWARALARQLVADEQRADDVVQQAWLAAVERPPTPGPGLRAWFARLIRNVASNQVRAERRRMRHEQAAALPEPAPDSSAPHVVDEFTAQQLVAQALLELDEPYRETLLRRWYRDEKPAAIARAMALPVKTVETRLARGLERLRAKLTELKGGDARAWGVLLVPLAKQAPVAATAVASGGVVGSLAAGVMAMTMTAKLLAAGVVAAAAVGTWAAVGRGGGNAMPRSNLAPASEVAAARASDGKSDAANGGAAAPITASRAPDASAAAAPAATKRDPLAPWRGAWHLHGRVVAKGTHAPVVGAEVVAQVEEFAFGPQLASARTDANGEFTLERLSKAVRLHFQASGHLTFDAKLGEAELAAERAAPPREFAMEPLTFGTLVCTLRSRDGRPVPAAVRAAATVSYGPAEIGGYEHERFDRLPPPIANGPSVEMAIASERVGDLFRIDHAPACTPITLLARAGHSDLGKLRIEPLAPGETRAVAVPVACGILVATSCVDAGTHEPVSMEWADANPPIVLHWTGANACDHRERDLAPRELDGMLALPGPGHITLLGTLDGFAPFSISVDVADGAKLSIPLTRWRPLLVKVATADGGPWLRRGFGSQGETATTRCKGMAFVAAGRAPDCLVVPAGAKLPAELAGDTVRTSRWRAKVGSGRGHFTIAGFEGFAPSEPLRVGVYDDGRLVGSADVPATAPLLQPDPPAAKPAGVRGESIPDEPVKPWADRFGPTQTITVTVTLPPPADGSLRFEAVGADDGEPVANYEVELTPLENLELESPSGSSEFKVADANHGRFVCTAIPAGEWRLRIRRGPIGVDVWSDTITIEKEQENDLGTLKLAVQGTFAVRIVDEADAPLADAEVRVVAREDEAPLEFALLRGRHRLTHARTDSEGHELRLELPARAVRVEVQSDGFSPAFADVDVHPGVAGTAPATCTITLHRLAPPGPTH